MKTVVNFFSAVGFVILTSLMVVSGNSLALTPDGMTPANEGICDPLKADGISKGLYGLCVAYCEAQDEDLVNKEPPNTKILENYNKKKQASDPTMPCVHAPCPCWTTEQFASITSDGMASFCDRTSDSRQLFNNPIDPADPKTQYAFADTAADTGRAPKCSYVDNNSEPSIVDTQTISVEEAQICFDIISQACEDLGL